ncbi:hypothetical protein C5C20_01785 [Rathayibacter rathayi]|uniref:DUF5667 domain-containing protein n=2 Tax=Rathayibacter rathayi TaxID=33887 RepID=A0ABX5AER7_RATRA|nr:hypothetical protein C5C34_05800 [Rathayibacter rathayi]PPF51564.1 hypothetical protein C5C08_01790 [Rathayibacter rathayi]PPF83155.1 hypothetical protein C5C14_01830 [Rathayibacter rathayi]PPG46985.1 hypothetical protein C5C20_01785 [Rathayibacter rathayi]PPG96553.1 hypothetical protein C5C22_02740 [Rathayibacter rathayi]
MPTADDDSHETRRSRARPEPVSERPSSRRSGPRQPWPAQVVRWFRAVPLHTRLLAAGLFLVLAAGGAFAVSAHGDSQDRPGAFSEQRSAADVLRGSLLSARNARSALADDISRTGQLVSMTEPLVAAGKGALDPVTYAAFVKAHQATSKVLAVASSSVADGVDSEIPPLSSLSDESTVEDIRQLTDELHGRAASADEMTVSARASIATLTSNATAESKAVDALANSAAGFTASVLAAHPEVQPEAVAAMKAVSAAVTPGVRAVEQLVALADALRPVLATPPSTSTPAPAPAPSMSPSPAEAPDASEAPEAPVVEPTKDPAPVVERAPDVQPPAITPPTDPQPPVGPALEPTAQPEPTPTPEPNSPAPAPEPTASDGT